MAVNGGHGGTKKRPQLSGKKKAHEHKLFCPVGLGTTPVCPGDFTGSSLGQIRWKLGTNPGFLLILHSGSPANLGRTRGTNPGLKGGTESYVRLFLALDERQITHLMTFLGGELGLLPFFLLHKRPQNTPWKSHIDHILGGPRLDE